jgi:hypothetical protein
VNTRIGKYEGREKRGEKRKRSHSSHKKKGERDIQKEGAHEFSSTNSHRNRPKI